MKKNIQERIRNEENYSKIMNALVKAKQQSNANKDYLLKMELKELYIRLIFGIYKIFDE